MKTRKRKSTEGERMDEEVIVRKIDVRWNLAVFKIK